MVKYFSRKSKCSFMLWSWWYKQVLINFAAYDFILLCSFLIPCIFNTLSEIIDWEISICLNVTSLSRNDEKCAFHPYKWGVNSYTYIKYDNNWLMKWFVPLACLCPWWHYTKLLDTAVKVTTWSFGAKKLPVGPTYAPLCHSDFYFEVIWFY